MNKELILKIDNLELDYINSIKKTLKLKKEIQDIYKQFPKHNFKKIDCFVKTKKEINFNNLMFDIEKDLYVYDDFYVEKIYKTHAFNFIKKFRKIFRNLNFEVLKKNKLIDIINDLINDMGEIFHDSPKHYKEIYNALTFGDRKILEKHTNILEESFYIKIKE